MPLFTFTQSNGTVFSAPLESSQCTATCKNNNRCKRKVIIGQPYCYTHLLYQKHLKVKDSTIPGAGKGVFAEIPKAPVHQVVYQANSHIVPYTGQRINNQQLNDRYGDDTAPYALRINANTFVDPALQRGIGSIINHQPVARANVRFVAANYANNFTPSIRSTKNIRNGQELFINYGRDYRMNDGSSHTTSKK